MDYETTNAEHNISFRMREHVAKAVIVYTIEDSCRSTKEIFDGEH